MNILILGATGRVGSRIAALALQDGHHVTVLVRSPDKLDLVRGNVTIIEGNALSKTDMQRAAAGNDAVISALSTDGTTTLSETTPLIVETMLQQNIRRIVTIGTAGILQSKTSPGMLRYQSGESNRKLTRAAEEHHRAFDVLLQSPLDWTIICPTYLPDGPPLGAYRTERDFLPDGAAAISVSDTAEFAYRQLTSVEYVKSRVGIAY
ncbi:NAD(P)-dependent oxidoreductase [Paenibacillus thalictri]|uniref:SDR family oxidoreductase n=1 Tax=Paenibacillus thalictri TaxID=2527873 RepID=A0A4Q9E0U4_9BACL|nr:SDR family oxidoreductase [Paenibacillus thalictri]TBL81171.1 SDR family oxidoreductase [Paenibacillus thalictri]